jgi:histone deacetylase 1/2
MRSKWVLKKKLNELGQVVKYKARLVGCGYSQTDGIDFHSDLIYSPVGKYKSIRMILAMVVQQKYVLYQLDVETAFLHADVQEEIYMQQPSGYEVKSTSSVPLVCKLRKSLYGLRQSPANWNGEFNDCIMNVLGFTRMVSDSCVYVKMSKTGRTMILFLFVDDLISAVHPEDVEEWKEYKSKINSLYRISDLGICSWILQMGIQYRVDGSIQLNQSVYVSKLLKKFGMQQCRSVSTPMTKVPLIAHSSTETDSEVDTKLYMSMIGSLLYAAISTRIDLSFSVGCLSRFLSKPTQQSMEAAKRVFRYLAGNNCASIGLVFKPLTSVSDRTFIITAYSDADWASDVNDRKSITGYVVMINGNPVSWVSKKQRTVATSTAEAEYTALSAVGKEVLWYRTMLNEMGYEQLEPTIIYVDNRAAIQIAQHDSIHDKSKHIAIAIHWIRDTVAAGHVQIEWIPTGEQVADLLTKALPMPAFMKLREALMG